MIKMGSGHVIPDPDEPTKRAIDTETGEVVTPVFYVKVPQSKCGCGDCYNPAAPTMAELERGQIIGWAGSLPIGPSVDLRFNGDEWEAQ